MKSHLRSPIIFIVISLIHSLCVNYCKYYRIVHIYFVKNVLNNISIAADDHCFC